MSVSRARRLAVVIHDLNSWAGMERCTLEVARRLSHRWPVDVYAFTLEDHMPSAGWGDVTFHRVRPGIRSPELLKSIYFYGVTTPQLLWAARSGRRERSLVHAAGACSLVSDVVQVHFVQAAWKARRSHLPPHLRLPPRAGSGRGLRTRMLGSYYEAVLRFNIVTERLTFTAGKSYIAISHRIARELSEHFGLRENIRVIHHGVDATQFCPVDSRTAHERETLRREMGIAPGDVMALLVGAYDRKGLATAVESLVLLHPENLRRMKLVAVGPGNRSRYADLAREKGLEERVILVPHTPDVGRYYRAGDVFLLPTLYEPFGMVILEAMACGLPPIVSRDAGASELIQQGASGLLLTDPSDPKELASHLDPLIGDARKRAEMAGQARSVAASRTWERVALEYEAALAPLMNGTAP